MSFLGALNVLEEVGLNKQVLEKAVADNIPAREEVIATAKRVESYWKGIAPVGTGRPHDIYREEHNEPGDYRDSIHTEFDHTTSGALMGKVGTRGYLARWLEYGSKNNKEHGYGARVAAEFGAEVIPPGTTGVLK